jgi:GPH family glycoside/pentoside/hexuronide:cation symporter
MKVKFGFAIAGLLSGAIMTWVGFDPNMPAQLKGAITGLRLFYSGLPILGTTIAILAMRTYDVREEKANEIRALLEARQTKKMDEEIVVSTSPI